MGQYLLGRLLRSMVVLVLFLAAVFFLAQIVTPGDFAIFTRWGEGYADVQALREELGLDLPIGQRFLAWMADILRGDFGRSFREWRNPDTNRLERIPVSMVVFDGLTLSAFVLIPGIIIAFRVGEGLGKATAWRRSRIGAGLVTVVGVVFYTTFPPLLAFLIGRVTQPLGIWCPGCGLDLAVWSQYDGERFMEMVFPFLRVLLLSLAVAVLLLAVVNRALKRRFRRGLPAAVYLLLLLGIWLGGWCTTRYGPAALDLSRLIAPLIAIYALLFFGETMLVMRTSMTDTLYEEYVFAARAKGLRERVVRDRHAARNALLPVLSRLIVNIPYALSALVMVEDAFGYQSFLGTRLFDSMRWKDIPLVMGCLVVIGIAALVARFVLDIAIAALDPRIRFAPSLSRSPALAARSRGAGPLGTVGLWLSGRRKPRQRVRLARAKPRTAASRMTPAEYVSIWWRRVRRRAQTSWKRTGETWRIFAENRLAVFGLVLIGLYALMAIAPPILMSTTWSESVYDPAVGFDPMIFPHPAPPSVEHLLGTDVLGRDVLSMLLAATPDTFVVALTAAAMAAAVGTVVGAVAAYSQGRLVDTLFQYLADVLLVMPVPIIMVIVGARFPEELGAFEFGLLYGVIAGASSVAIVMRSQALKMMVRPFIEASKMAGAGAGRIVLIHLIPHMLPLAAVQMMLTVAGAIMSYGFIAFTGVAEYRLSWGTMVYTARTLFMSLGTDVPWPQLLAPGLALSLFAAAFYLIARGLHRVAEPRLRAR